MQAKAAAGASEEGTTVREISYARHWVAGLHPT